MDKSIKHKRGDTFVKQSTICYVDSNGAKTPVDLSDVEISAQVRLNDALVTDLTAIVIDAAGGVYKLLATASETSTWQCKTHQIDIQFTFSDGRVMSTETFDINVIKDVTHV